MQQSRFSSARFTSRFVSRTVHVRARGTRDGNGKTNFNDVLRLESITIQTNFADHSTVRYYYFDHTRHMKDFFFVLCVYDFSNGNWCENLLFILFSIWFFYSLYLSHSLSAFCAGFSTSCAQTSTNSPTKGTRLSRLATARYANCSFVYGIVYVISQWSSPSTDWAVRFVFVSEHTTGPNCLCATPIKQESIQTPHRNGE